MKRLLYLILLLATPAFGQIQYQYFVTPNTVTQHSRDTLTGKNYAAAMTIASTDTVDISAGWNVGQPFTFYVTASATTTLVWGTTITANTTTFNLDTGITYKFVFTYQNSKWRLDLDPLWFLHYSAGTFWQYRTKTTNYAGYPGDGNVSWNNSTQTSATKIALSHLTDDGLDIHILLSKLTSGKQIIIQDANVAGNFQAWHISGTPLDSATGGDYWTFPVTLDSSGGTGTTGLPNNHPVAVIIPASGGGSGTVTSVSISGSNGITTGGGPITTTGTLTVSGDSAGLTTLLGLGTLSKKNSPLIPTLGGTGLTSIATGDILYGSASNTLAQLTIGANGTYLHSNGTNVSWVAPSSTTSSAIIDLSSPASQIVKDTLVASNPLIHVSSKPTIPQFYYVVKAADIPTNTVPTSYMAVLTIGGKNRHTASAVTVNWVACRGTNPATEFAASSSISTPSVNFWYMNAFYNTRGVVAGDTLSVKMWSSTIDTSDFRYATIYFIPRLITPPNGQFYFYGQSSQSTSVPWDYGTVLAGANSGVAYANFANQPSMFLLDSATSSAVLQPVMTQTMPQLVWMIGNGTYMGFGVTNAFSDVDGTSATGVAATLYQLPASNGTARRIRYIRKLTISTN